VKRLAFLQSRGVRDFFKYGVPFLGITAVGTYGLSFMTEQKFEVWDKRRAPELFEAKSLDIKEELRRAKQMWTDDYDMRRGPGLRDWELRKLERDGVSPEAIEMLRRQSMGSALPSDGSPTVEVDYDGVGSRPATPGPAPKQPGKTRASGTSRAPQDDEDFVEREQPRSRQ
jgi:hypothetical protein